MRLSGARRRSKAANALDSLNEGDSWMEDRETGLRLTSHDLALERGGRGNQWGDPALYKQPRAQQRARIKRPPQRKRRPSSLPGDRGVYGGGGAVKARNDWFRYFENQPEQITARRKLQAFATACGSAR